MRETAAAAVASGVLGAFALVGIISSGAWHAQRQEGPSALSQVVHSGLAHKRLHDEVFTECVDCRRTL